MRTLDIFEDFPKEWTKYGLLGCSSTLEMVLSVAKVIDNKEDFIRMFEGVLNNVKNDLKELEEK